MKLWLPIGLIAITLVIVAVVVATRPAESVLHARCASDDDCPGELVCGPRSSVSGLGGTHLPYCAPSCRDQACPADHRCYMGACYLRCDSHDECGDGMRCIPEIGCIPRSEDHPSR